MYGRENEHVRGNGDFQKKGPPEHSLLSVEKCLIKQIHWFSDVYGFAKLAKILTKPECFRMEYCGKSLSKGIFQKKSCRDNFMTQLESFRLKKLFLKDSF
jgi:hypothetical protein